MEFTKYPFKHLGKISKKFGVPIDSLRDIAANKFMALIERFDPKDFIEALPRMLKPLTIKEIKVFFADEARKLGTSFLV